MSDEEPVAHGELEGALRGVEESARLLRESVNNRIAWNQIGVAVAVVVAIFAVFVGVASTHEAQRANRNRDTRIAVACADRLHTFEALRAEIIEQNRPQKPSKPILDALPLFRPFFTPGNPLYDEQVRAANEKRDRILGVLGSRPVCK